MHGPSEPEPPRPRAPATISVVIPVLDDAGPLARCLAALGRQTVAADEIIVVDNGSIDDSAAVARAAGARVLTCAEPGIAAASTAGYDSARGELILRLDADCLPDPTWIQDMREAFARAGDAAAFTGHARFMDGPRALRVPLASLYLGSYTAVAGLALGHRPLFGSNLAFRRDAWHTVRAEVHRCDPELHDDLDLAFHLGELHRIGRLPRTSMSMSMRPFTRGDFGRRVRRGFRSVLVHWPRDFPPFRWRRLIRRWAATERRAVMQVER